MRGVDYFRREFLRNSTRLLALFGAVNLFGCEDGRRDATAFSTQSGIDGEILLNIEGNDKILLFEDHLKYRVSNREFQIDSVSFQSLSRILYAAQGESQRDGWRGRHTPSAGALYPMELYVVVQRVEGIDRGVYRYLPKSNSLKLIREGDFMNDLYKCGYGDPTSIRDSAFSVVLTYVEDRLKDKYQSRASRYALIESGAVAQNIYLQSAIEELGVVFIGAVDDALVSSFLDEREFVITPVSIMPVGVPKNKKKIENSLALKKEYIDSLQNGWSMAGSSLPINSGEEFGSAKSIWRYRDGGWINYSNSTKSSFVANSFEGFWVYK